MRVLIAGLESPIAGVRSYPFAKFFHRREEDGEKYVSSFFVALRFAHSAKRVDLGPLIDDFLQVVNAYEGRGHGMDLTIHLVAKKNLPSFVFSTEEVKFDMDVKNEVELPFKQLDNHHDSVAGEAASASIENADNQAGTPLPSSGRNKPSYRETSPAPNISPHKRARMS